MKTNVNSQSTVLIIYTNVFSLCFTEVAYIYYSLSVGIVMPLGCFHDSGKYNVLQCPTSMC